MALAVRDAPSGRGMISPDGSPYAKIALSSFEPSLIYRLPATVFAWQRACRARPMFDRPIYLVWLIWRRLPSLLKRAGRRCCPFGTWRGVSPAVYPAPGSTRPSGTDQGPCSDDSKRRETCARSRSFSLQRYHRPTYAASVPAHNTSPPGKALLRSSESPTNRSFGPLRTSTTSSKLSQEAPERPSVQ